MLVPNRESGFIDINLYYRIGGKMRWTDKVGLCFDKLDSSVEKPGLSMAVIAFPDKSTLSVVKPTLSKHKPTLSVPRIFPQIR